LAVPSVLITVSAPELAPPGTIERSVVSLSTVKKVGVLPNRNVLAVKKPTPWTVTSVPTGPVPGENVEIAGGTITVKLVALVALPTLFVTLMGPEGAPAGTAAVITVSLLTV
jgi:hypothetical protein